MARIRSIKPEFWGDLNLAHLSRDARLLYIALWNQCDEHARMHGDPRWVKGHCLPYDDDLNLGGVNALLEELARARRITRYVVDGAPYLFLPKLADHQRLEPDKSASRHPAPPGESVGDAAPSGQSRPSDNLPGKSAPTSDKTTGSSDLPALGSDTLAQVFSDEPAQIVVQHVAGSMEHVAGSMVAPPGNVGAGKTINQRANEIATAYVKRVPLCNHQAVAGVVRKALNAGYADAPVWLALARLIDAERSVTADSLRIELEGPPKKRSTTDDRVAHALELAAKYEEAGL